MIGVSTIIATTAKVERAPGLRRAIHSIREASASTVTIIVVINGQEHDPAVFEWLRAQPHVECQFIPQMSAPYARFHGRLSVSTPFFATLDDDDELLPGALDRRLAAITASPDIDFVVTNAMRVRDGSESLMYGHLGSVESAPLSSLLEGNWLNSGNAFFRTSTIPAALFENATPFYEWTWIAFNLCLANKRLKVLDEVTYLCHERSDSMSRSKEYRDYHLPFLQRLRGLELPLEIVHGLRRKEGAEWHCLAEEALENGHLTRAANCHLRSLIFPGGWRFIPYSRHIFRTCIRNLLEPPGNRYS